MNVNVLLVLCLLVLIKAESMLESNPLDNISELKPEAKETRNLDCCSAAASDISKDIAYKVYVVSTAVQDTEARINGKIQLLEYMLTELKNKIDYLEGRLREK